ncbi:glycosyltransferase [Paenibacillus aceris]|uniref:Glycosyltransferase involved in cell wall biosynthesis n=1 Tax=Paenibacillus aceris TaxID=869555 RepID=A0ABS4I7S7_9BACL|nr:glycosyltransferase [Paenibacillus aceris]MBP1966974.1 glycosyltransferase involved in cell wall biosynthesis [Paenibacillus aceris]NHW39338.1 glycosyltransferase [Paenibacillus aceris]
MNILLEGIFYNGHGFAEGNRILLRILYRAGYQVRILARDSHEKNLVLDPKEVAFISSFEKNKLRSNDIYLCNFVGSSIRYNPDFRINIARTTFETDRIPDDWVPELNKFNEVWVQSTFNVDTFAKSGVEVPLRLIPNFFDINAYDLCVKPLSLPVSKSFLFLAVFDLQQRKGYDILLEAFLNEFSQMDDVALVVKIRNSGGIHKLESIIDEHHKSKREMPTIYMIDQMLTTRELLGLYKSCHAFVLPTRGEGWGRPFFEAMLMEMPVIGTGWSGQTDFMNESNAFLVQVDRLIRIKNSDYPMFNGHLWAQPSIQDLQNKMRYVFEHAAESKQMGKKARSDLLRTYKPNEIAARVTKELNKFQAEEGENSEHLIGW